jgi:hypothetical protein
MKLQFENVTIEKSGKFTSQNFDIGDKRVILEILRGKMYSNPISTICQEIMSNALDAHREIGKDLVPIVVKIPNKLEPDFYIKDFGPSISPERMSDVYIKYGASTKRDDNTQKGGYGLGCKSPFSYTDSFSVICVTQEIMAGVMAVNAVRMKRQYVAHIDPTGLGEMTCVSEEPTTEETGTTVIITPKEGDYNLFSEQVMRAAVFWPVRPKILGARDWKWPEIEVAYKGNRWEIHKGSVGVSCVTSTPFAILDGIPYPIKGEHLFKTRSAEYSNFKSVALRLHFQTGEIPITANREEIDYQERTIQLLEERINAAFVELRTYLTQSVSQAPTLTKAIVAWNAARRHPQFGHLMTNTSWRSPKATPTDPTIVLEPEIPLKDVYCDLFWKANNEFGFNRSLEKPRSMHIDDTTLIVEDNAPTAMTSRQRLANLFTNHPDTKKVYLISFYRKMTIETITSDTGVVTKKKKVIAEENSYAVNKKIAEIKCHWNYLDIIQLSDYEKKKVETTKTATGPKVLMLRYLDSTSGQIKAEPFETLAADKTTKKYYLEGSGNSQLFRNEKGEETNLTWRDLSYVLSYFTALTKGTIRVHLVTTRHKPLLDPSWIPLRDYAKELVQQEAAKNGGVIFRRRNSRVVDRFSEQFVKAFHKKLSEITDQSCLPVKYFKDGAHNVDSSVHAFNLSQSFNIEVKQEDTDPMEDMFNKLKQSYPIFGNLSLHYNNDLSSLIADLVSYVNMKNEKRPVGRNP